MTNSVEKSNKARKVVTALNIWRMVHILVFEIIFNGVVSTEYKLPCVKCLVNKRY